MKSMPWLILFLMVLSLTKPLLGELRVAQVFSDGVVLQRGAPLRVWGWASAGQEVTVQFHDQEVAATVQEDGAWTVTFQPLSVSADERILKVASGAESVAIDRVLVGDVWHASGQSNMAMTMSSVADRLDEAKAHLQSAQLPAVRFCHLSEGASNVPLADNGEVQWVAMTSATMPEVSAAAFYFAQRLHATLAIPIGIIDSSRGGTPIEPYIPEVSFIDHPTLIRERELGQQEDLSALGRLAGGVRARDAHWLPGRLFNSRLAPMRRFAVKGAIWYQGESNSGVMEDPRDYQYKMRALIRGWRQEFEHEAMPFYYVQLPGSGAGPGWPYLREQQRLALNEPFTGMVVTIDLLDSDIHPPNKVDVGYRLARWALAETYGYKIVPSGPLFKEATFGGGRAVVHFDHADGGLILGSKVGLEEPEIRNEGSLAHVELADASGEWHPATASIQGVTLVVQSDDVIDPRAVRYGYAIDPQDCHLYNAEGLPASPFCSHPDLLSYDPMLPVAD